MNPNADNLQPKPVSASKSEMIELVLPNDTNPLGALLGGRLMHWIDLAGALAAHRHSHSYVVTASMDHIDFFGTRPCRRHGPAAIVGESRIQDLDGGRRQ